MQASDDAIRGRTVVAADGYVIGQISAMQVDLETWRVEALQVKLRKEVADRIGAERGMFTSGALFVPTRMVQSVSEAVVLSTSTEELKELVGSKQRSAA